VAKPGNAATIKFSLWEAENKLTRWKEILEETHPVIKIEVHILRGHSVQAVVIECATLINADLIIIGKQQGRRLWLSFRHNSPDIIAKQSTCPVLTVGPGAVDAPPRVIVIPVGNFIPTRKLALGVFLARKYKAQIHLLAMRSNLLDSQENHRQVFLRAYQELREKLLRTIQCSYAVIHDPAKAVLAYAESVKADMILVNPVTESGHTGITGYRHISDMLERNSRIQILDVLAYS
jgi:nucleotide-binding universal stress UspA family protein